MERFLCTETPLVYTIRAKYTIGEYTPNKRSPNEHILNEDILRISGWVTQKHKPTVKLGGWHMYRFLEAEAKSKTTWVNSGAIQIVPHYVVIIHFNIHKPENKTQLTQY